MGGRGSGSGRSSGGGGRPSGPIQLERMSDTQLATFVQRAYGGQIPAGFHDDPTQRLIHAAGWNGQPKIVTATQAEAMARKRGAVALYRTVKDNTNTHQSSQQIADGFRTDTVFSTGGWGGQVYGGGVYFSDSLAGSKSYGHRIHNPPVTIGAVLNDKAKVISDVNLRGAGSIGEAWVKSHPKAAKALGCSLNASGSGVKASAGALTAMAMAMGYNVVRNEFSGSRAREHYYTILDRTALTTSTKDYYPQKKGMKGR